jgi:hypothetical protein
MKMALLVFGLLFCTAAFGQYFPGGGSAISTEPFIPSSPNHPAHASFAPMAQGQNILGAGNYLSADGERPPSDFPQPDAISLGAAARELKKTHVESKKAKFVWIN